MVSDGIKHLLSITELLSPEVQQKLLPLAEESWEAIIDRSCGNSVRAMKAFSIMANLGRKIDEMLKRNCLNMG